MTKGAVWEVSFPYFGGLLCGALMYWEWLPLPHNAVAVLGVVAGACGVFVGFALTAAALLIGLSDRKNMKDLIAAGALARMMSFLFQAVFLALMALVISVVLLGTMRPLGCSTTASVWFGFSVGAALSIVRVASLLAKIIPT